MTTTTPVSLPISSLSAPSVERRLKTRYPISLPIRFCIPRHRNKPSTELCMGMTLDISSSGLLVQASTCPPVGSTVEMRMEWPFLLDKKIPLQLVARGRVVRVLPVGFAVCMEQHEFRTVKK